MRNPFAGILFCECGRVMSLRYYKKKDGTERCSPRIICDRSHCDTGSCTYDEFISSICDILEQHIKEFSTKLKSDDTDSVKIHQNLINNLEKKLRDLQAKELSQWEAQSDPNPENRMPQDIFKMLNAKLLKEKEETQQALNKAYDSMPEPVNYEERIIKFQDALSALKNPKATAEEKNILLKSCIERIEYKREKPERLKKKPGEKKGEVFKTTGAYWSNPPIEISIKLNV
jgi:hypothetical protein